MDMETVYTAYITLKSGRLIYAKDYGLKCFVFRTEHKRNISKKQ